MTAALVELVPDPEARRVIAHAYAAIGAPVHAETPVSSPAGLEPPESPHSASASPDGEAPQPPEPEPPAPLRSTRRKSAKRASKRAQILHLQPEPAEDRIRAALAAEPGLSVRALAKQAGTSESTASKYRRLVRGEGQRAEATP